jgi:endonuclease III
MGGLDWTHIDRWSNVTEEHLLGMDWTDPLPTCVGLILSNQSVDRHANCFASVVFQQ